MQFELWVAYLSCAVVVMFVCVLIVTQKPKNAEESDTTLALSDDEPLLTHADGTGQSEAVVDSKEEQEAVDVFPPKSALIPVALTPIPATATPTPIPLVTTPIPARPTPNPVPPIVSPTKTSVVRPAVNAVASAARTASTCVYTHRPLAR